jgi:hypothetical protein
MLPHHVRKMFLLQLWCDSSARTLKNKGSLCTKILGATLSVKILRYFHQTRYFWGVIRWRNFFSPTLLLLKFLLCTYLNHYKFHFISMFALSFDTLYLFDLLVLVLDQRGRSTWWLPFFKDLKDVMKGIQPFSPLDGWIILLTKHL